MAARTSLKHCILAAVENFYHNKFSALAIVRHTKGKYYSLLQPSEFQNLPMIQDPTGDYIVFLGTEKELRTFFSLKTNQIDVFPTLPSNLPEPP